MQTAVCDKDSRKQRMQSVVKVTEGKKRGL